MKNDQIWACPSDTSFSFLDPNLSNPLKVSYGMNCVYVPSLGLLGHGPFNMGGYVGFNDSAIQAPAETIVCTDSETIGAMCYGYNDPNFTGSTTWNADAVRNAGLLRHNGTVNVLFFDGHVKAMKGDSRNTELLGKPRLWTVAAD